jgi:hypothetical protein
MPVTINFTSGIFDKAKRNAAATQAISKSVREFAKYVPEQQIKSKPSGRLYRRRGGKGFRRFHRASRSGQRPAVDTGKLTKSTKGRMTGQFKGQVVTYATNDGFDYASFLQFEMNRPIQIDDDKAAQEILDRNAEKEMAKLT